MGAVNYNTWPTAATGLGPRGYASQYTARLQANCRLSTTAFEAERFDVNERRVSHGVTQTLRRVVNNAGAVSCVVMHTEPKRAERKMNNNRPLREWFA